MENCLFCKIVAGDIPSTKVYEDEKILAFRDIAPQAPTHVLVVPKMHIADCNGINEGNCDVVARPFIEYLRAAGIRVPEDVSIVSYDDYNNAPGSLPLTTYRVDTEAMCRIALQRVTERARGDEQPPCRIVVGGESILRDSVFHV